MNAYIEIIKLLPDLTSEELEKVRQRIAALQSVSNDPVKKVAGGVHPDESWIMATICETLSTKGILAFPNMALGSASTMTLFRKKLPNLLSYLEQFGPQHIHRRIALALCVGLLYDNLSGMNIAISVNVIIRHLDRIPGAVNVAFPGYAAAGLLPMIVHKGVRA